MFYITRMPSFFVVCKVTSGIKLFDSILSGKLVIIYFEPGSGNVAEKIYVT